MRPGISLLFALGRPLREALSVLPKLVELGAEVVELVDEGLHSLNMRRLRLVRKALSEHELEVAIHAPFVDLNIGSPHEPTRRFMLKRLLRSLGAASYLEASAWVFHPGLLTGISHFYPGGERRQSMRSVRELAEKAEELGVRIFIENGMEPVPFLLKKVEDFERFFSELGDDLNVGLALDIAHAFLCGQVSDFIRSFSTRIGHIHIHDNDGKTDLHLGLGSGKLNWREALRELWLVGYRGPVVVESVERALESLELLSSFTSTLR